LASYQAETQSMTSPRRTTTNAAAAVLYDDNAAAGWPNNNDAGSIFLPNLTPSPAAGASWLRSDDNNSSAPQALPSDVVDHPGGDVGSPGFVPGIIVDPGINGDFNLNGVVDAADFVVWRNTGRPPADYDLWRSRFGMTTGVGSGATMAGVPEPRSAVLLLVAMLRIVGCVRLWRSC